MRSVDTITDFAAFSRDSLALEHGLGDFLWSRSAPCALVSPSSLRWTLASIFLFRRVLCSWLSASPAPRRPSPHPSINASSPLLLLCFRQPFPTASSMNFRHLVSRALSRRCRPDSRFALLASVGRGNAQQRGEHHARFRSNAKFFTLSRNTFSPKSSTVGSSASDSPPPHRRRYRCHPSGLSAAPPHVLARAPRAVAPVVRPSPVIFCRRRVKLRCAQDPAVVFSSHSASAAGSRWGLLMLFSRSGSRRRGRREPVIFLGERARRRVHRSPITLAENFRLPFGTVSSEKWLSIDSSEVANSTCKRGPRLPSLLPTEQSHRDF